MLASSFISIVCETLDGDIGESINGDEQDDGEDIDTVSFNCLSDEMNAH